MSLPDIPDNVTHVYTRQHKAVGLQAPYEGPFRIESRPSKSTVKLEVGNYKSGEKRYEIRHFNDLKIAHLDSLAAPAQRPKLGRPTKAATLKAAVEQTSAPIPNPTVTGPPPRPAFGNKQAHSAERENSNLRNQHPEYLKKGPLITEDMYNRADWPEILNIPQSSRPVRTTRNPTPKYVDAMWTASSGELAAINASIGGRGLK